MRDRNSWLLLILPLAALVGCRTDRAPEPSADTQQPQETQPSCDDPAVRDVVARFGERLKMVSLLADDSMVERQIREAYTPFVTPDLLQSWTSDPAAAPGRQVSSPWPERIEVRSIEAGGAGACLVGGDVVYLTSTEAPGEVAAREPVSLTLQGNGGWRVSAYEAAALAEPDSFSSAVTDAEEDVEVLRRYYAAIGAGQFRAAYQLWGGGGEASGQTFEAFAAGFEETAQVALEAGAPGRVEGAAGSRYVEVPVIIRARTRAGESQRFEGTYTLRRSVVDGATAEQRAWRVYAAELREVDGRAQLLVIRYVDEDPLPAKIGLVLEDLPGH